MADLGKAYVQIVASAEGISGSIQSAIQPGIDQVGTSTGASLAGSIGKGMEKAGGTMTKGLTLPIIGAFTGAIKTTADFESAMAKVSAISGASGEDFDKLSSLAREMGATTKFSASEAAEGLQYMAMAGWKTEDMMGGLPGILNLAAASGESLGTTSDIVTDAMTAFGMKADEAGHFADVIAAASNNANTNVSMLGESFKYVAPVAGSLGFSVEDTSVALGLMANSGIKASQAGTSLRTLFTNMANPTETMAKAMDTLGVSLDDGNGNMKSLGEILGDLRAGFGDLQMPSEQFQDSLSELNTELETGAITESQYDESLQALTEAAFGAEGALKAQAAAQLAGKQGMSGLLAIVNTGEEDYNKLTDAINNADGTADTMAATMQDTLGGQMTTLSSQLQELAISFGEILVPLLRDVVTHLQSVVEWFTNLDPSTKSLIMTIAGVVAVIGPILLIGGKILGLIATISMAMPVLTAVIGALTGPVGIVIAVFAGLVAAGVLLYKNWDKIKEVAGKVWDKIKEVFSAIKDKVIEVWESIKKKTSAVWESIKSSVTNVVNRVKMKVTEVWNAIKTKTSEVWDGIKTKVSSVVDGIKNAVSDKVEAVKTTITTVWDNIKTKTAEVWDGITSKVSETIDNIKNTATEKFESVKSAVLDKVEALKKGVSNIVDKIKGLFNFEFKLPKLKKPKFVISPAGWKFGDLLKGIIPTLDVKWVQAYQGGIANGLSVYTVAERGPEAIIPLSNSSYMRPFAQAIANEMGGGATVNNYITINGAEDPEAYADRLARRLKLQLRTV